MMKLDGLYEGDTAPIELTFKKNGIPVNITGYGFKLKIGYSSPVVKVATVDADQINNTGKFKFPLSAGDLKAGEWPAEYVIIYPDATERTQAIEPGITIKKRLA